MQAALLASYAGASTMLVAVQLSLLDRLELSHQQTHPSCQQLSRQGWYLFLVLQYYFFAP